MQRRSRRANKREGGTWIDDPLVKISGKRVRAALQHSGLSLPELADRLDEKRQTLDYIARGKTRRCRRSRRAAIAHALAVPEEWLGGGGEGGMDWLLGRLADTLQGDRAINRLGRRCEAAVRRDGSPAPHATGLLLQLALPAHWRSVLFHELPPELVECGDLPELERDLARTALANAIEAILRPWLTGQAKLDYQALQLLSRPLGRPLGRRRRWRQ